MLLVCVEKMRRMLVGAWPGSAAFGSGIATGHSILRSGLDSVANSACRVVNI